MKVLSGVVPKIKSIFGGANDLPMFQQIVGAASIAVAAGFFTQVVDSVKFSDWSPQLPYWIGGVFLTPFLLRGLAALSWSLGLAMLWAEEIAFESMWALGKFSAFVGVVLVLCVTGAEAGNVHSVFSLGVPQLSSLPAWLEANWQHPVFLTGLGLTFLLWQGSKFLWRYRPEGPEQWNPSQTS